jgi:hypothetical protein
MLRRAVAPAGRKKLYREHPAFSADRAGGDIDAADPLQLLLPGLLRVFSLSDCAM